MHIAHLDPGLLQVDRQILGHALGQGGDEHTLLLLHRGIALGNEVVDLALDGADFDFGIQKSRGADHLLHDLPGPLLFKGGGGGGDVDPLAHPGLELREGQGAVVKGRGQAEAVVDQGLLAAAVSGIHGPYLGQGHMALVHKEEEVIGEVVQQGHGGRAGGSALDHPGVVLDAAAEADLLEHFDVVHGALADALGLQELLILLEPALPFLHLALDVQNGPVQLLPGGHIVAGRVDGHMIHHPLHQARDGIDLGDAVDLVPEKFHPDGSARPVDRVDLHGVPTDTEGIPGELDVVALVADLHQLFGQLLPGLFHAGTQGDDHVLVVNGVTQAVDAADGGHHDHIPPLKEGGGGGVAQALDLLVDGGVLLDIGVGVGDVGLGLVVVVVGNKIFHRIIWEKLPEFRAELGG